MLIAPQHWFACAVISIALLAAISDHRTGLIPNRLLLAGLGVIVALRALALLFAETPRTLLSSLALFALGALISALIPLALYICGAMGAGDVKLLAVCGAGLGPVLGLEAELYSFAFGALYALAAAAYGGRLFQTLRGSAVLLTNPLIPTRLRKPVPEAARTQLRFGPAIAAGVIAAVILNWGGST